MGEILVPGITQYRPATGRDDRMPAIPRRMPPPHLRRPDDWAEPMRAAWGDDTGTASAVDTRIFSASKTFLVTPPV